MRMFGCFICLLFMYIVPIQAELTAKNGELDLSQTSLAQSGPVILKGNWNFYWEKFVSPDELVAHEPVVIRTPTTWGSQALDIDDQGYGTYHLTILLSERDVGRSLALHIPSIASAYEMFIDGEKLRTNGKIGTSRNEMTASALPKPLYFTPDDQVVELVIHVSNYVQRKGGIWDNIRLGTADQITDERERRLLFQTFIATGLLLMGIYHIGLYFFRSAKSTLFFGLASLCLFLRMVFVGEILAIKLYPNFPWELEVKIEYLSVFFGISFLVLYFYHLYEGSVRRFTSYALASIMIAVSLPILFLPAIIYTKWMLYYQCILLVLVLYILFGLVKAVFHRFTGAKMNLAAGLIFLASVLNDIFYYNFLFDSIDLVTMGLYIFIFTQMFMLAKKFAAAYEDVKILKEELEETNENLEDIVNERTEALRVTNENLIKAEKARKDLLSNISHELGNPLTSVIGYIKAIKDGVSNTARERHLDIAYRKSLRLKRITDDLRQLVKLEQNQLTFEMKSMELRDLSEELKQAYDWEMFDQKVTVDFDDVNKEKYIVRVDLERIEQVFTNIVNNSLAHTNPGDHILVSGRYFSFANACVFSIKDTGVGIKEEHLKQLFDRFYRVKNLEMENHDGMGLGLSISKIIMDAHLGRIGVRSVYGRGSTFYFILPVTIEE